MKPYGLKRKDRVVCKLIHRKCNCGDWESKYTVVKKKHNANRRIKKSERQRVKLILSKY